MLKEDVMCGGNTSEVVQISFFDSWQKWTWWPGNTTSGSRTPVSPQSRCLSLLQELWKRTTVRKEVFHSSEWLLTPSRQTHLLLFTCRCHLVLSHLAQPQGVTLPACPGCPDLHGDCPGLHPSQCPPGSARPLHPCPPITAHRPFHYLTDLSNCVWKHF